MGEKKSGYTLLLNKQKINQKQNRTLMVYVSKKYQSEKNGLDPKITFMKMYLC